jgi:hypothetical protein
MRVMAILPMEAMTEAINITTEGGTAVSVNKFTTPRPMEVVSPKSLELTKRGVDSAIRADSKESGALWRVGAKKQYD